MGNAGLKNRINEDLKQAMLAGDKPLVSILRSLKSAVLYKEVEDDARDNGLDEQAIVAVLKKEKKSRQDAYAMYSGAGETDRADEEQYQIGVIAQYLPEEISEDEAKKLVSSILADKGVETVEMKHMGLVMGQIKATGAEVDGAIVSKIIKEMVG